MVVVAEGMVGFTAEMNSCPAPQPPTEQSIHVVVLRCF